MKTELFDENNQSRGYYSSENRVNELTGREWVYWTKSVITNPYPPNLQHKLRNEHGGQKPPDLCADLIRVFTKKDQCVLDPFMGVGGVLLGAARAGREAVGVELNPRWIEIYQEVCRLETLKAMETVCGDALTVLREMTTRSFDMVLTDVPYWKMDTARRSTGAYKKTGEASRPNKLSALSRFNEETYPAKTDWLQKMQEIFTLCHSLLKDKGYLVTFIGDMYYDNAYHCLSAELAQALQKIPGLIWKANLIWYDVSKKLHLYGYQYAYIPSMIHQNILVFRKEM